MSEVRHAFVPGARFGAIQYCGRAGCRRGRTNQLHRLNGRCSVCLRIFRNYELDSSRRCDECRP